MGLYLSGEFVVSLQLLAQCSVWMHLVAIASAAVYLSFLVKLFWYVKPPAGPSYLPVESVSDLRCVVESAHPYKGDEDRNWPVVIKGAETIEVGLACHGPVLSGARR